MSAFSKVGLLAISLLGCTGYLGGGERRALGEGGASSVAGSGSGGQLPSGACSASVPLRRLTNFEYENTLRDLFPGFDLGQPGQDVPGDVVDHAFVFDNRASTQGLSATHVDSYGQVAERVARLVTSDAVFTGCDPTSGTDACFEQFLATFGARAFRRPLTAEETSRIRGTFASVKAGLGFQQAMQAAIERVLQSPQFLYRLELDSAGAGPRARLGTHELATRLSYLVLGSTPDTELAAAAGDGRLSDRAVLLAEARRLLQQDRARRTFEHLFDQWLGLPAVEDTNKDQALYPRFSSEVARLMLDETRTFLARVLLEGEGGFGRLLSADYTFVNQPLADYYGLTPVPGGETLQKVQLPPGRGAGLLGQGSFASLHASDKTSHPIKRGVFVRTRLLCDELPPPPGNIPPAPMFTGHETARELMAKHSAAAGCQGCHELIDPIGLGFENLDAAGVWRELDVDGLPVDASGYVSQGGEIEGPFVGVAELGAKLSGSPKVHACMARQFFRFSFGREPFASDGCTLDELTSVVAGSGDYAALVLRLVESDAFQYRGE